jgi:hypothetical protein
MTESYAGIIDYSSKAGAELLAEAVRAFWRQQGRVVRVEVSPVPLNDKVIYVVNSELQNGLPPKLERR